MNTIETLKNLRLIAFLFIAITISSCSDDDVPPEEDELEVITDVSLIFTNNADPNDVVTVTAQDIDGIGSNPLVEMGEITLSTDATYTLTFTIFNNLETPGEDIGEEIEEEDDEHQIFFSFTDGAFESPTGSGNISPATGSINYNDEDSVAQDGSGNPVGLNTTWTTPATGSTGGMFTALLKHQPDVKTATSTSNEGETDFELTFVLNIQ